MIAMVCDRCGKQIDFSCWAKEGSDDEPNTVIFGERYGYYSNNISTKPDEINLCRKCMERLQFFLNGKGEDELR